MLVLGVFLNPYAIWDSILYAVLGFALLKTESRVAAIVLFLYSTANLIMTFANAASENPSGGTNYTVALLIFGFSIRAVQATFKLHRIGR
jgi:hypothetical protein